MTTLENRPNTALVVIDVQRGVLADAHERDAVVAHLADLASGTVGTDDIGAASPPAG